MKVLSWINNLVSKCKFPKVESVEHELKKAGVLRIILGVVIFVRFFESSSSLYFVNETFTFVPTFTLLLILLFTVGFSVPLVSVLLLVFIRVFDAVAMTNTLGSTILFQVVLVMILMNVGQYYSLDGWLSKKKNKINVFLQKQYSIIGTHTNFSLTKVYLFSFFVYGIISLGALGYHIQDPYWTEALTVKSLLSNSYLSSFYEEFRWLENTYPVLTSYISYIGFIGQSLFQFFMLILVFNKFGNFFVKWWAIQFFIISLFVINLSYLPHVEIILWLIIYFPIKKNSKKISILYDDHCNLCKKSMLFFKKINYNNKYTFLALSKNRSLYEQNNLNEKEVKTYMVGWYKNKLYKGYNLYYRILLVNPLLWIFIPLFMLGYITGLGKLIYNQIAENRYKYFGVCEISFEDDIQKKETHKIFEYNSNILKKFYIIYGLLILSFIAITFPFISELSKSILPSKICSGAKKAQYYLGLEIPLVFNVTDLSMGDNWMVIYRKEHNKNWELVPITAEDGHRMNYNDYDVLNFTNHNSDYLYFGTSLLYRRKILKTDSIEDFHENQLGKKSIEKRIKYDYKFMGFENEIKYKIIVYKNSSSKVTHWIPTPERHDKTLNYECEYDYNGTKLIKTN